MIFFLDVMQAVDRRDLWKNVAGRARRLHKYGASDYTSVLTEFLYRTLLSIVSFKIIGSIPYFNLPLCVNGYF